MTHQFHRAFHAAANKEGGILNIGPTAVSINNPNLRAFLNAVEAVEAIRAEVDGLDTNNLPIADANMLSGTDWGPIFYVPERDSYNIRYRGVYWESLAAVVVAAAAEVKAYLEDIDGDDAP